MNDRHVQVLLYTSYLHIIGGIETFVYNFVELMSPYYDIGLYCPGIPVKTAAKLSYKIPIFQSQKKEITCDTLIMIRIMDDIPENVTYKHSIRMCHACKSDPSWHILPDCDKVVHVSEASKRSFQSDGEVIYNPLMPQDKKALILVSATRIPAKDKGQNADRMIRLAEMLNEKGVQFLWFNFSDVPLRDAPKGMVNVGAFDDMRPYIRRADYLVQLSDQEGFGYTIVEALTSGTAVLCTPFETTKELGVMDGENGYIVPFDMSFDVEKLLKVPKFKYPYSNDEIVAHWRQLLGESVPSHKYFPDESIVFVEVIKQYKDNVLNRVLYPGEVVKMARERAEYVMETIDGYIRVLEG